MLRSVCLALTLFSSLLLLNIDRATAKTYRVYFMGGQSNMDGYGYVKDLPKDLSDQVSGVMIFHANPAPDAVPVDGRGICIRALLIIIIVRRLLHQNSHTIHGFRAVELNEIAVGDVVDAGDLELNPGD